MPNLYYMLNSNFTFKTAFKEQANMLFGKGRFLFHIIFWVLILYIINISKASKNELNEIQNIAELIPFLKFRKILTFISVFCFIYSYLLIVIPFAFIKKYKGITLTGITTIIIFWLAINKFSINLLFKFYKANLTIIDATAIEKNIFSTGLFFQLVWFFFALYYFIDLYQQQKQLNKYSTLLSVKTETEKRFLQNQINPHFLFNTLNNIYSLALKKSPDGINITKQLKSLLQYMLYDCVNDKVSLKGEIDFLKNYIGLEKIRNKSENLHIDFQINSDLSDYKIAPLLLINFIENAFKHGVKSNVDESFVKINISIINNLLLFDMSNSVPQNKQNNKQEINQDSGIGLENVKRRLSILYPNKHSLKIGQSEKIYNTYLSINL